MVVALFGPLSLLVLESVLVAAALQEGFFIVAYGRVRYIVFYYWELYFLAKEYGPGINNNNGIIS